MHRQLTRDTLIRQVTYAVLRVFLSLAYSYRDALLRSSLFLYEAAKRTRSCQPGVHHPIENVLLLLPVNVALCRRCGATGKRQRRAHATYCTTSPSQSSATRGGRARARTRKSSGFIRPIGECAARSAVRERLPHQAAKARVTCSTQQA